MVAAKLIVGNPLFGGTLRSGVEVVANNRHDDYTIDQTDILSNSAAGSKNSKSAHSLNISTDYLLDG